MGWKVGFSIAMILGFLQVFLLLMIIFFPPVSYSGDQIFLREEFNDLNNWNPLNFPKIKRLTIYSITSAEKERYLKAESDASASGIIYKEEFNVHEFSKIRWRWRIENIYIKGDVRTKEGDDYPIRVYIAFKYDPEKATFSERLKYKAVKLFYGEYPPHSAISYIWSSKEYTKRIFTSSYTDRAKMILLEQGSANLGKWKIEDVNIMEDYKDAFGEYPPSTATIAIMNDSDNTGEKSISYVDYMEVYK
jgi:hypothetical protein